MLEYMETAWGNPSSLHRAGLEAEKGVKEARRRLERLMPAAGGRIAFTSGGTEADNLAIFGAAAARRRQGNRIVTTAVEHPAVLECCARLEREGFEVIRAGMDGQGRLDLRAMEAAIDEKTILVSIMQVNNEVGTIMPVDEAGRIIGEKQSPALLHCDAIQSFGKIPLPKTADMISVSGHKIHGPKGSGALWMRRGLQLPPLICGGGQEGGLRSGTENVPAVAGFGLAAQLADENWREKMDRICAMRTRLIEGFEERIDDLVINSPRRAGEEPDECCGAILNVSFLHTRGEVILHTLEQGGICVSTGSACSSNQKGQSHVLQAVGCDPKRIEGAIRFSLCADNTMEEIEETIRATEEAVKRFRRLGSFR